MSTNYEKQFIRALRDALNGQVIETESGFHQVLRDGQADTGANIHVGKLPLVTGDTFNLVIEPKGPGFPIETLGRGADMSARTVAVGLTLTLYFEHPDEQAMVDILLDAAWWLSEFAVANRTLGGATRVIAVQGEYGWATVEEDEDEDHIGDTTNVGVFVLPIVAEYRRS